MALGAAVAVDRKALQANGACWFVVAHRRRNGHGNNDLHPSEQAKFDRSAGTSRASVACATSL